MAVLVKRSLRWSIESSNPSKAFSARNKPVHFGNWERVHRETLTASSITPSVNELPPLSARLVTTLSTSNNSIFLPIPGKLPIVELYASIAQLMAPIPLAIAL